MKLEKAPGIDQITAELLKTGGEPIVDMLHKIALKVWILDWSRMILNLIHKKKDDKLN